MARTAGQSVDININAHDGATPAIANVSRAFQGMPQMFSKAAGAMRLVETASGQMGGQVAAAVGKLSGLASMVAVGGPVGIGIAAVTAAIGAGALAWRVMNFEVDEAKRIQEAITGVLDKNKGALEAQVKKVRELHDRVRFFGMTDAQIARARAADSEKGIAGLEQEAAAWKKQLAERQQVYEATVRFENSAGGARSGAAATKVYNKEIGKQIETLRESVRINEDLIATGRERIRLLGEEATESVALAGKEKAAKEEKRDAAREINKGIESYTDSENAYYDLVRKRNAERRKATVDYILMVRKFHGDRIEDEGKLAQDRQKFDDEYKKDQKKKNDDIQKDTKRRMADVGKAIGTNIGDAFRDVASGTKSAGEALRDTVISSAETSIMAYAGSAAAAAAFSQAGIPVIGPILAITAAGIIFGLVKGYLSQVPKAATGGVFAGPSFTSIGERGPERVLSDRQTTSFERLVAWLDSRQQVGGSMAIAGGGSMAPVFNFPQLVPGSSVETARAIRKAMRIEARLRSRGHG